MIKSHGGIFGRTPVFDAVEIVSEISGSGFDAQAIARASETVAVHEQRDNPHPQYVLKSDIDDKIKSVVSNVPLDGGSF